MVVSSSRQLSKLTKMHEWSHVKHPRQNKQVYQINNSFLLFGRWPEIKVYLLDERLKRATYTLIIRGNEKFLYTFIDKTTVTRRTVMDEVSHKYNGIRHLYWFKGTYL